MVYASTKQELVLFFGAPGSGKSTFFNTHLSSYERISQDKLGTADKCIKACQQALSAGRSAVIDNTNKTLEQRSRYTSIAKALKIPIRIFIFEVPKDRCMHNNKQRKINPYREHFSKKVSDVVIHDFFKNKEVPKATEGYADILNIEF